LQNHITPGKGVQIKSSFLGSKEFQEWQNKYDDIVVLGGIH
jgi:hypothetical protein